MVSKQETLRERKSPPRLVCEESVFFVATDEFLGSLAALSSVKHRAHEHHTSVFFTAPKKGGVPA